MTEEVTPMQEQDTPAPAEFIEEPHFEEVVEPNFEEVVVEHIEETPVVEEVVVAEVELEFSMPKYSPPAKSKNEDAPTPVAPKRGSKDKVVRTSALVFKSHSHNSVSVGLVQERLVELGHADAGSDKYGWLSDGTMKSLAEFAKTTVEKTNPQDASLIEKLFAGTQVKVVS